MIAQGAEPILQARLRGMRPADMVMISMVGPIKTPNHVVLALTGHDYAYDWRWVHNLDICLVVDDNIDWGPTLKDVAIYRPDFLCVWHKDGCWGAKVYLIPTKEDVKYPVHKWQYELDFLPFLDFQNEDFKNCRSYEDAFTKKQ